MKGFLQRDNQTINWLDMTNLIEQADLGKRGSAEVERAFKGSFAGSYFIRDGKIIGTARAISDGVTSSARAVLLQRPKRP